MNLDPLSEKTGYSRHTLANVLDFMERRLSNNRFVYRAIFGRTNPLALFISRRRAERARAIGDAPPPEILADKDIPSQDEFLNPHERLVGDPADDRRIMVRLLELICGVQENRGLTQEELRNKAKSFLEDYVQRLHSKLSSKSEEEQERLELSPEGTALANSVLDDIESFLRADRRITGVAVGDDPDKFERDPSPIDLATQFELDRIGKKRGMPERIDPEEGDPYIKYRKYTESVDAGEELTDAQKEVAKEKVLSDPPRDPWFTEDDLEDIYSWLGKRLGMRISGQLRPLDWWIDRLRKFGPEEVSDRELGEFLGVRSQGWSGKPKTRADRIKSYLDRIPESFRKVFIDDFLRDLKSRHIDDIATYLRNYVDDLRKAFAAHRRRLDQDSEVELKRLAEPIRKRIQQKFIDPALGGVPLDKEEEVEKLVEEELVKQLVDLRILSEKLPELIAFAFLSTVKHYSRLIGAKIPTLINRALAEFEEKLDSGSLEGLGNQEAPIDWVHFAQNYLDKPLEDLLAQTGLLGLLRRTKTEYESFKDAVKYLFVSSFGSAGDDPDTIENIMNRRDEIVSKLRDLTDIEDKETDKNWEKISNLEEELVAIDRYLTDHASGESIAKKAVDIVDSFLKANAARLLDSFNFDFEGQDAESIKARVIDLCKAHLAESSYSDEDLFLEARVTKKAKEKKDSINKRYADQDAIVKIKRKDITPLKNKFRTRLSKLDKDGTVKDLKKWFRSIPQSGKLADVSIKDFSKLLTYLWDD